MSLYSLRTNPSEGLPFIITKFTSDLEVESTYPTGLTACECPAGHRPSCRHRQMLPILRQRVDTAWFWDFEGQAWVDPTGEANKPAPGDEVDEDQVSDTGVEPQLGGLQEEQILMGFHQPELVEALAPKPAPTFKRRI